MMVINIALADPTSYSKILPLGDTVHPDSRNRVIFRAEISGESIIGATVAVANASGAMHTSPTNRTYIGVGWDVSRVKVGAKATVKVTATDESGHTGSAERTVTLVK